MTKQVVAKDTQSVVDYASMGIDMRAGFETVHSEQLRIPNMNLCQALSESVQAGAAKAGDLWDSLQGENLGKSVEVVLLGVEFGAAYFEVGQGLVCKSRNGETSIRGDTCSACPYNQYWGNYKKGQPSKCTRNATYLVVKKDSLASGVPYPMVTSFSRMSFPAGQRLYSAAMLSGKPIFFYSYNVTSKEESGAKGKYYTLQVTRGQPLEMDMLKQVSAFYQSFARKWKESDHIIASDDVSVAVKPEIVDDI